MTKKIHYTPEGLERKRQMGRELKAKYPCSSDGGGFAIWKQRDPDALSAHARKQCAANREKGPAALAKWRAEHPGWEKKQSQLMKERYARINEVRKAGYEKWRRDNAEMLKESTRKMNEHTAKSKATRQRAKDMGVKMTILHKYATKEEVDKAAALLDLIEQKLNEKSPG